MAAVERKNIVLELDLARPVRSDELAERLLRTAQDLSAVIVRTEEGPLLGFRLGQRTFLYLGEVVDHLKSTECASLRG